MATWGPDKKKSRTSSTSSRAPSRSSAPSRQQGGSSRSTQTAPRPRNGGSKAQSPVDAEFDAPHSWRREVAGRENDLIGVGFIAAGVLIGLAVYLKLAGPLGSGVDKALGWL